MSHPWFLLLWIFLPSYVGSPARRAAVRRQLFSQSGGAGCWTVFTFKQIDALGRRRYLASRTEKATWQGKLPAANPTSDILKHAVRRRQFVGLDLSTLDECSSIRWCMLPDPEAAQLVVHAGTFFELAASICSMHHSVEDWKLCVGVLGEYALDVHPITTWGPASVIGETSFFPLADNCKV